MSPERTKSSGHGSRRYLRRWWVLLALALASLVAIICGVVFVVSWNYSNGVLVPRQEKAPLQIEVLDVGRGAVKLERAGLVNQPKVYGLEWASGSAILGRVIARDEEGVTRRLGHIQGRLEAGDEARITLDTFRGDPYSSRGLRYRLLGIRSELGGFPAWQVGPNRNPDWAIFIHGINSDRGHGLRIAPAIRNAGLTALYVSYRNDRGAPPSPDGKHHLGASEWRDVEAAMRYAVNRGAQRIALVGFSMGGAIALQLMLHSSHADRVRAIVLDSPALDWSAILAERVREAGLPGFAAMPLEWVVAARIGTDWSQLDVLEKTDRFRVPTLLIHGEKDRSVPVESSDAYAQKLDQYVRYLRPRRAGHVQSWNLAPGIYEGVVTAFLRNQFR